jgi:hypothetical protein
MQPRTGLVQSHLQCSRRWLPVLLDSHLSAISVQGCKANKQQRGRRKGTVGTGTLCFWPRRAPLLIRLLRQNKNPDRFVDPWSQGRVREQSSNTKELSSNTAQNGQAIPVAVSTTILPHRSTWEARKDFEGSGTAACAIADRPCRTSLENALRKCRDCERGAYRLT